MAECLQVAATSGMHVLQFKDTRRDAGQRERSTLASMKAGCTRPPCNSGRGRLPALCVLLLLLSCSGAPDGLRGGRRCPCHRLSLAGGHPLVWLLPLGTSGSWAGLAATWTSCGRRCRAASCIPSAPCCSFALGALLLPWLLRRLARGVVGNGCQGPAPLLACGMVAGRDSNNKRPLTHTRHGRDGIRQAWQASSLAQSQLLQLKQGQYRTFAAARLASRISLLRVHILRRPSCCTCRCLSLLLLVLRLWRCGQACQGGGLRVRGRRR